MSRVCVATPTGSPTLRISQVGDVLLVAGELDVATAPLLDQALEHGSVRLLDLSGVTFIDAFSLRTLVRALRPADPRAAVVLGGTSRCVDRLITLAGLNALTAIRPAP